MEKFYLSASVMLSLEMTRSAIKLVEGQDCPWGIADILAEDTKPGRSLSFLVDGWEYGSRGGFETYRDATNDEILRIVRIRGSFLGRGGIVEFESKCELHNYRSMWEAQFVELKVWDKEHKFFYQNWWKEGKYTSNIYHASTTFYAKTS